MPGIRSEVSGVTAKKYEAIFTGPGAAFDALFPQYAKRWQSPRTHSQTNTRVVLPTPG